MLLKQASPILQELTMNRSLDPNGFVRLCRKYKFLSFELGPPQHKKQDTSTKEVFAVLQTEWRKVEDVVHELLVSSDVFSYTHTSITGETLSCRPHQRAKRW